MLKCGLPAAMDTLPTPLEERTRAKHLTVTIPDLRFGQVPDLKTVEYAGRHSCVRWAVQLISQTPGEGSVASVQGKGHTFPPHRLPR